MENPQRPLVNQRLYYCRLHVKWMEQALEKGEIARNVIEQSFSESVLFHLVKTYQCYLAEIATAYGAPCEYLGDVMALEQLLSQQQLESAEAREIAELASSGWLGELLETYQAIPAAVSATKSSFSPQAIPAVQVQQSSAGLERSRFLLESMEKLIENQRDRLEEW